MGKKKRKQKVQNETRDVKNETFTSLDDERITRIIVNALIEYDKQKQLEAQAEIDNEEIEHDKKLSGKEIAQDFMLGLKIIFRPKKHLKHTGAGAEFLKSILQIGYQVLEKIILFSSVFLFALIPMQYIITEMTPLPWYMSVLCGFGGCMLFVLSRIFRILAIEVDEIKDNNYLFGLFAAMASIISIIVAIIAVVK